MPALVGQLPDVGLFLQRGFDLDSIRRKIALPACVVDMSHRGTVDGAEHGFVCEVDHDAVMGMHPDLAGNSAKTIK